MKFSYIAIIFALITCSFNIFSTNAYYFNASQIVVIADVHGDLKRFKYILRDADVIDKNDRWIAKSNTAVVQLGDQIDPKRITKTDIKHHFDVIYFTARLERIANDNGCIFVSIIGNHEHMNMDRIKNKSDIRDIVAKRSIVTIINSYLFCHGSLKLNHHYILQKHGKTIDDVNMVWSKYVNDSPMTTDEIAVLDGLILNTSDSILYTKHPDGKNDTYELLNLYEIDYMMVGHMLTKYIHLKNRIWYLDQLLEEAFDNGIYSYITIINDNIVVNTIGNYFDIHNLFMFSIL